MNASMKFTGAQETTSREAVAIPKENLGDEESAKVCKLDRLHCVRGNVVSITASIVKSIFMIPYVP